MNPATLSITRPILQAEVNLLVDVAISKYKKLPIGEKISATVHPMIPNMIIIGCVGLSIVGVGWSLIKFTRKPLYLAAGSLFSAYLLYKVARNYLHPSARAELYTSIMKLKGVSLIEVEPLGSYLKKIDEKLVYIGDDEKFPSIYTLVMHCYMQNAINTMKAACFVTPSTQLNARVHSQSVISEQEAIKVAQTFLIIDLSDNASKAIEYMNSYPNDLNQLSHEKLLDRKAMGILASQGKSLELRKIIQQEYPTSNNVDIQENAVLTHVVAAALK